MNMRCQPSSVPGVNREDLPPTQAMHQSRQRGEPEPVRRLVTNRPGQVPTKHNVLVPKHKQHRRNRQQLAQHLVQQRTDHPGMLAAGKSSPFRAAMTFRTAHLHCAHEAEPPVYDWRRSTPAVRNATPQLGRYTIRLEQRARFQFLARNDPACGLGWK